MTNDELPEGWATCLIGEISPVVGGGTPPSKDATNFTQDGGIPWLTPADLSGYREIYISRGARNLTDKGFSESSAKMLPKGALLFSSRAPVGYVAIASNPVCTNQGFKSFVLPAGFDSRFGYFYLRHIKPLAEGMATGTTFKELSGGTAAQLPFVVAPLAEQKRIADKLEAVLGRVDACRARLDRVPDLLKRFRQSVLAAATSGLLTEDWRGIDTSNELEQYLANKTDRNRDSEPTSGHDILTSRFPQEWALSTIGKLFRFIDYRGRNPTKSPTGKRVITAKNIRMGKLNDSPVEFISEADYQSWMTRGFPAKGDILFVTEGHTMGFTALNERDDEFALAQRIITLQPYSRLCSKFYFYVMLTDAFQQLVAINATGSAAQGIKASKLRDLPFPFPSLPEQAEIVRRVEALFAFADRIEARLTAARAQVERLTPATLSKAFRGDLIPQDPNDEPAAKLLERMRNARAEPKVLRKKSR